MSKEKYVSRKEAAEIIAAMQGAVNDVPYVERVRVSVEVDGAVVSFADRAFCFTCEQWFAGNTPHICGGKRVA